MINIAIMRRCLDFFITDHLYNNDDERYRASILAGCLLFISIISLLTGLSIIIIYAGAPFNYIGLNITAFICILYLILAFVLKHTGKTKLLAQCFAVPLYGSLVVSSFVSGGAEATSTQIMFLLPLMMFFTAGSKAGICWTIILIITQIIIYSLYWTGYDFAQHMTFAQRIEQSLVHWLIALTGIVAISWVYERANQRLISERNLKDQDNQSLSQHDKLTGSLNRPAFFQLLKHRCKQANNQRNSFQLILIDIINLGSINQRFGFTNVDNVIIEFSARLSALQQDGIVARIDGKRFALIYPSNDITKDAAILAPAILERVSEPYNIDHEIISLQIKLSISHFANNLTNSEQLLNTAETTLSRAKASDTSYLLS